MKTNVASLKSWKVNPIQNRVLQQLHSFYVVSTTAGSTSQTQCWNRQHLMRHVNFFLISWYWRAYWCLPTCPWANRRNRSTTTWLSWSLDMLPSVAALKGLTKVIIAADLRGYKRNKPMFRQGWYVGERFHLCQLVKASQKPQLLFSHFLFFTRRGPKLDET